MREMTVLVPTIPKIEDVDDRYRYESAHQNKIRKRVHRLGEGYGTDFGANKMEGKQNFERGHPVLRTGLT